MSENMYDGDESTKHGFNIGASTDLQWWGTPHRVIMKAIFSDLPSTTTFEDVQLSVPVTKKGYTDYKCSFKCYLVYYSDSTDYRTGTNISGSASKELVGNETSGDVPLYFDKTTLYDALTWISAHRISVNNGELAVRVEGANIYVKEIYLTLCYTT